MSMLGTKNTVLHGKDMQIKGAEVIVDPSSIQLQHHWKEKGTFSLGTKDHPDVSSRPLEPEPADC